MQIHCTAILLLMFVNKGTSVVRNLHVSDLNKIAQIIEVASEGEHTLKHNHAVSIVWSARANLISHLEEGKFSLTTIVNLTNEVPGNKNHIANYLGLLLHGQL